MDICPKSIRCRGNSSKRKVHCDRGLFHETNKPKKLKQSKCTNKGIGKRKFTGKFYQTFKEANTYFHNYFKKLKKKGHFQTHFTRHYPDPKIRQNKYKARKLHQHP